jgi:hypothetical protein
MPQFLRRALAVAVGSAIAVAAGSPVLFASHAWGNYHWARTANPFTLKIGNNMTGGWPTHFNTAVSDWNQSAELGLAPVAGGSSGRNCKMVAGTVQVCNRTYGNNGWLGLASINITGGVHITQGSAKMNDTYFNTPTYNNPNEKLHVVCQEIGHTFGLGHTSEDGSSQNTCMDYFSNTGANANSTQSTHPNSHDYQQLSTIYAHLDSFNTATSATAGARAGQSDVNDDDPNSWGELMRQSENGRSSVYKNKNRDGSETLTHVYWTLEAAESCPSCDHRSDH